MNATELLIELEARGVLIEAAGDRLRVDAPKGAVTPELREALAACKTEVLAILTTSEDEIAWRVEAMLPHIPDVGAIPFLVARTLEQIDLGCCPSCGDCLNGMAGYICGPCSQAKNRALDIAFSKRRNVVAEKPS